MPFRFRKHYTLDEARALLPQVRVWLTALKREVGIPAKLGAVKVTRQHLPKLLDVAVDDICHKTNPRPCTREDFERIFTEAI